MQVGALHRPSRGVVMSVAASMTAVSRIVSPITQ
jgi:hypothetical protein